MKKILITLLFLMVSIPSFGDSVKFPHSYKIVGKNYIFVDLVSYDTLKNAIGRPYEKPGLYKTETDTVPLWTIKGLNNSPVFISSDLIYLVNLGPWPLLTLDKKRDLNVTAIKFFKNGELIKEYKIADLENYSFLLGKTVSHYLWKKNARFINNEQQFELTTLSFQKYIFDVKTGEIVSHTDYILILFLVIVAGLAIVFIIVYFIIRKEKKNRLLNRWFQKQ